MISKVLKVEKSIVRELVGGETVGNINKLSQFDTGNWNFGSYLCNEIDPFRVMIGMKTIESKILKKGSTFFRFENVIHTINSL